jgi:type II secretory pathway pseudopilin PulG
MTQSRGYMLVELLIGAAITCAMAAILFQFAVAAQGALAVQGNAADQQQRLRVATEALRHDLLIAGAGPSRGAGMGPLITAFPPVIPARRGLVNPDPELTIRTDRISVVYVPETRTQTVLRSAMPLPSSPLAIDGGAPGCAPGIACDFAIGDRAIIYDPTVVGVHDFLTVGSIDQARALITPVSPLSQAYPTGARVALVTMRDYYFDSAGRRLMVYNGDQSDVPLVDHVADMRIELVADPPAGVLATSQLTDGPFVGVSPNRFDADLLHVRRIRVTIRLEADSSSGAVRELAATIDVAPPNMAVR